MTQLAPQIRILDELVRQHAEGHDLPRHVPFVKLADALARGDPLRVVAYFKTLGIEVREPEDLFRLNDDPNEEEINAFKIPEGVAVSVESDDLWLVFEIDQATDQAAEADGTETVSSPSSATSSPASLAKGETRR